MHFASPGKADVLFGGQFGSEGKGAVAAWLAGQYEYDVATTNAGAQAGHTSIGPSGKKFIAFHLPTVAVWTGALCFLNAGTVIDLPVLLDEIQRANEISTALNFVLLSQRLLIHPNAAVITAENKASEGQREAGTTKIASTQKGVGHALASKVMREAKTAKDYPELAPFIRAYDINGALLNGARVVVEVPQGFSLSLNASPFYPYTTSRDCGVMQGLSDAGIHPQFLGAVLMVARTFPIRVGAIVADGETLGTSGGVFEDQVEISFADIGQPEERTTVTGRVRRIFMWSYEQILHSMAANRPSHVALTFCNYCTRTQAVGLVRQIQQAAMELGMAPPTIIYEWGPSVREIGSQLPHSPEIFRQS